MLAAQLALSGAVDRMVITVRGAGTGDFSDYNDGTDYGDVAVLVGMRTANPQIPGPGNYGGTTASVSLGLARLYHTLPFSVSSGNNQEIVPAVAFNADVMAHLRVIGIGASVFGAAGASARYAGLGITLGLGKIH